MQQIRRMLSMDSWTTIQYMTFFKNLFKKGGRVTPTNISDPPPRKPSVLLGCVALELIRELKEGGWNAFISTYGKKNSSLHKEINGQKVELYMFNKETIELSINYKRANIKLTTYEIAAINENYQRVLDREYENATNSHLSLIFPKCFKTELP